MQYKDEFICEGTPQYVASALPHKKVQSGGRLGEMIAEQFGHTSRKNLKGEIIHKLEITAYPIEKWNQFMEDLYTLLPEDLRKPVKALIDKMDPPPAEFYGDLLQNTKE